MVQPALAKMKAPTSKNDDLHGNVPDTSATVLLLVDVVNDLAFPGGDKLLRAAPALAKHIASLKSRCQRAGIPAIYVNDNRNRWRSDFPAVLRYCLRRASPGRKFVEQLVPRQSDYVVLKPKHSAFFATPLEALLSYLHAKRIVLAGLTTNACILSTAVELYVRDFEIIVPSDCVSALNQRDHRNALELMKTSFGVKTTTGSKLKL